jgi:hypothetical protein
MLCDLQDAMRAAQEEAAAALCKAWRTRTSHVITAGRAGKGAAMITGALGKHHQAVFACQQRDMFALWLPATCAVQHGGEVVTVAYNLLSAIHRAGVHAKGAFGPCC